MVSNNAEEDDASGDSGDVAVNGDTATCAAAGKQAAAHQLAGDWQLEPQLWTFSVPVVHPTPDEVRLCTAQRMCAHHGRGSC